MGYIPPPAPNPAKNPCCYMDGRDCYDVEQEVLRLLEQIDDRPRMFQRAWWRLQWLKNKYWPLEIEKIKAKYDQWFTDQSFKSVTE